MLSLHFFFSSLVQQELKSERYFSNKRKVDKFFQYGKKKNYHTTCTKLIISTKFNLAFENVCISWVDIDEDN